MLKQRFVASLLAITMVASCAENPATGGQNFSLVSRAHERDIGQATAEVHLKEEGLYKPSSAVTKYVTNLCQNMFAVTEAAAEPTTCIMLDSPEFNAWATPGYLNVNRGLLPFVHSEAQLAAVLGHESGHITARHVAQGTTNRILAGVAVTALGLIIASQTDSEGATNVAMQVGSLGAGVAVAKFGRDHEREADELGQRYMPRAGYDAREAVGMVEAMRGHDAYMAQFIQALRGDEADAPTVLETLTSSHPATPERIADARARTGEPDGTVRLPAGVTPATPPNDPQGRTRFLNAIDGLDYGPRQQQGIAGRTYIALPKARTVVRLPEGFVTQFIPMPTEKDPDRGQWWGRYPEADTFFKLAYDKYEAGMNAGVLLEQAGLSNTQALKLADGTIAYTATKQGGLTGTFQRGVAIPSIYTDKVVVIVFTFPNAATQAREETAIMQTIAQSKLISEDKAKALKPLRLDIQTVATGNTQASLAHNLPMGALREELFRAMNNLEPSQPLKVGSKVKMVVDTNQL